MQVYIRIFLAFIRIYWNICMIPVINQLWPAGPADTRMHDRPARPTAFCWNQNCPRICGEKMNASVKAIELRGSPPHMRGKGQLGQRLECGPGITPAYAGKRKACAKNAEMSWDHPRICGEKLSFLGGLTDGPESPPPPAYAGGGIPYRQACPAPAAAPRCPPPGWRPPLFRP